MGGGSGAIARVREKVAVGAAAQRSILTVALQGEYSKRQLFTRFETKGSLVRCFDGQFILNGILGGTRATARPRIAVGPWPLFRHAPR